MIAEGNTSAAPPPYPEGPATVTIMDEPPAYAMSIPAANIRDAEMQIDFVNGEPTLTTGEFTIDRSHQI